MNLVTAPSESNSNTLSLLNVLPMADVLQTRRPQGALAYLTRPDIVSCVAFFVFLQALDFLTTIIGLLLGAGELSPFIRYLMRVGPVAGLLGDKLIACVLAVLCLATGRVRALTRINYFFAALVLWNLLMILERVVR
jgi:hypothetical protein